MSHDSTENSTNHDHTSKKAYERVRDMIDYNTGGEQPPLLPKTTVRQIISHSNLSHEQANRALRAMQENGDLFEWQGQICLKTDASLLAVIEDERTSDITRKALIGKANVAREEVRSDG